MNELGSITFIVDDFEPWFLEIHLIVTNCRHGSFTPLFNIEEAYRLRLRFRQFRRNCPQRIACSDWPEPKAA
jgi:hypothetical protein